MWLNGFGETKNFYFIGIGGVSMSSLAKLLRRCGYGVAGSDLFEGEETQRLKELGVPVLIGVREDVSPLLIAADAVVYTDAIPTADKELTYARNAGKQIMSRAELLRLVCTQFSSVTAVAGSHGKTTCTAMCAHVLKSVGVGFAAHIGGADIAFGNFYMNGFEHFVVEACEYKKNLLSITPTRAVLLNVDKDHLECYKDESELWDTFRTFCASAKTAIVCADDKRISAWGEGVTFGVKDEYADYNAFDIKSAGEKYAFTVREYGRELCRVKLNVMGRCNVYNALAAFAAMRSYGFSEKAISAGLENFLGVKRRFEEIGKYNGIPFVCDYAHHPREILSTVTTAKLVTKKKLYVVFQPHTYSRTKLLLKEFVNALCAVENLIIYKTYPAREYYDEAGSAATLAKALDNCLYVDNSFVLKTFLEKTVKEGDLVLFLGAGDIYYLAKFLLSELS